MVTWLKRTQPCANDSNKSPTVFLWSKFSHLLVETAPLICALRAFNDSIAVWICINNDASICCTYVGITSKSNCRASLKIYVAQANECVWMPHTGSTVVRYRYSHQQFPLPPIERHQRPAQPRGERTVKWRHLVPGISQSHDFLSQLLLLINQFSFSCKDVWNAPSKDARLSVPQHPKQVSHRTARPMRAHQPLKMGRKGLMKKEENG